MMLEIVTDPSSLSCCHLFLTPGIQHLNNLVLIHSRLARATRAGAS